MSNEQDKGEGQRVPSKLTRIEQSLQDNSRVVFFKNEIHIDPPDHRLVHAVTFYIAPKTPITGARELTRFANNLSDLKPSSASGASITNYELHKPPQFHPANVEFMEDVIGINVKIIKTPTILDDSLNIPPEKFSREDNRQSTLRRKILMIVFPHPKMAELAQKYEASSKDNRELWLKLFHIPLPDLEALVNGENPFAGLENF